MSIYVSKYEYFKRKLKKMQENIINAKIEISDNEAENLHFFNYFLGSTNKDSFTQSDIEEFGEYKAERPNSITVSATVDEDFTVWIYPAEWGRPVSAISSLTNRDQISAFVYGELNLPEGYTGMWIDSQSECTFELTW